MIKEVISIKSKQHGTGLDIVIEWTKATAEYFNVPSLLDTSFYEHRAPVYKLRTYAGIKGVITCTREFFGRMFPVIRKIMHKIHSMHYTNIRVPDFRQDIYSPVSVYYLMYPIEILSCGQGNCLPVFIDIWNDSVKFVAKSTKKFKLFYVTSRAVYDLIKAEDPGSNVRYMPLSVSDKYFSPNFEKYRQKTIDVIQFGRQDPLLHEYMLRYANEHHVEYIYVGKGRYTGDKPYISTTRGNIGRIEGRENFIHILASAKVSLVHSPGMLKLNHDVIKHGICFPTPRFYESAVLGCSLIGRYPDNEEFRELNMSRYCPNITNYDQFVRELERALAITPEELYAQNRDFILNSLTSKRAAQIQKDLEELVCQNS